MTQGAGGGRRSRIVIDVASAQGGARRGRGAGRRGRALSLAALAVVGLLLVVLVSCYVWWRGFERSPAYSLALLVEAAQHDDTRGVESLIDADEISRGFIPQVIGKLTDAGSPVPPQARASLVNAMPQLLPRVRETTRDEVAGALKGLRGNDSSRAPFFVKALGVRGMADVKEQGDAAAVTLRAGDRPVELTMRREGDRWRVITVKDDRLASDIAARLAASLPPSAPPPAQQPPRRKGR